MKQQLLGVLYRLWGWLPLPGWLRWQILYLGNQKFVAGVVAVVFNDQGQVLLFKHTYRPDMPWGLPGGWLQKAENPARAVQREIYEEAGVEIEILRPLAIVEQKKVASLDLVYLARWKEGSFRPSYEVSEIVFFSPENMPPILQESRAYIIQALEALRELH